MTDDRMKGSSINKIRFLKLDYHSGYSQEMHLQAWKCQKVKACCAKNPGGVLPYMGYIGMCRGIGYGF